MQFTLQTGSRLRSWLCSVWGWHETHEDCGRRGRKLYLSTFCLSFFFPPSVWNKWSTTPLYTAETLWHSMLSLMLWYFISPVVAPPCLNIYQSLLIQPDAAPHWNQHVALFGHLSNAGVQLFTNVGGQKIWSPCYQNGSRACLPLAY